MKSLLLLVVAVACCLPFVGCTDANLARQSALGNKHRVELWSGGKLVREWTSTGKVESESQSDGYYFVDVESRELVRVTGDLVITSIGI